MAYGDEPIKIISEFLRARLTDPRSRAESTRTETFNGTGAEATYNFNPTLGKKVSAITALTVGGIAKKKWQDYSFDLQNSDLTINAASGTDNISVTYKEGAESWIKPARPNEKMSTTTYPAIRISLITGAGERVGEEVTPSSMIDSERYQASVFVKQRYFYDDGTIKHTGPDLALYLGRLAAKAFKDYVDDLYPKLQNYSKVNLTGPRWEEDAQVEHVIFDFRMQGINIGG